MKLSTKMRCGTRARLDLALNYENGVVRGRRVLSSVQQAPKSATREISAWPMRSGLKCMPRAWRYWSLPHLKTWPVVPGTSDELETLARLIEWLNAGLECYDYYESLTTLW